MKQVEEEEAHRHEVEQWARLDMREMEECQMAEQRQTMFVNTLKRSRRQEFACEVGNTPMMA